MASISVPIIDIAPFLSGSELAKVQVARQVADAAETLGFFSIIGHGVPLKTIENLRETSHSFFEQPEEIKRSWTHPVPDTPRGFRAMAGEALGRTIRADAAPDLKEFYHYGPETWPDTSYFTGTEGQNYFLPNLWPEEPASFRDAALTYYGEMDRLVVDVIHIIALALGLPETWFDAKTDKHATAARLNYYPLLQSAPQPGHFRAGEHTDFGMLTILMGEDEPGGLQVRTRNGDWVDVETRPEFFIINIADQLMRWTNDRWLSNMHRVVNPADNSKATRGRLSVGYFFQPNYDALIECIPTCTGPDNPPKHKPMIAGKYRDLKYEQGNDVGQVIKL
ncbi:MAG: 2-oxoglutarate and iron-dependent oxygenase domain-containing protein [Pseudomonadota bacterium]|nr:2-oxoglutarate and iron-dependent oxygenase domain-containing protein [Pseudomonadota bacterium]